MYHRNGAQPGDLLIVPLQGIVAGMHANVLKGSFHPHFPKHLVILYSLSLFQCSGDEWNFI